MERTARTLNCGGKGGKPGPCPSGSLSKDARQAAYVEVAKLQEEVESEHKKLVKILDKYPRLSNGLITDEAKATPEYQLDKRKEREAFEKLRKINEYISKNFSKEHRAARDARRSAKLAENPPTANQFQSVAVYNSGKVREATLNGKKYLVARSTLIVPGVLSGSQGALYYPPEEVAQNVDAWNGMPLVLGHPTHNGAHVSARSPEVVEKHGLGYVFNATIRKGRLIAESWFDVDQTARNAPQVLNKLRKGQPVELSTGLFTINHPAGKGAVFNGKAYQYVARSYRPDHLAILVDQPGACSLKDGCGVLANNCGCESCATKNELSGAKACEIARDGTVHGKKLTKKQKGLFGAKCGESKTNNSIGDTSMTKKDKMVRFLTANCDCWKGKDDAKTLAALPDEKLKALVDNAKRAKESAEVVGNLLSTLSEGEEQQLTANELPALVANMKGAMKKGAFGKAPAEESEDAGEEMAESDMEEMAGKKPMFMKNAKKKGKYGMSLNAESTEERAAPTLTEWLESAPPEVRSVIANAQRIENKQKLEIVAELVGNSRAKTKADKEALHKFLMAKPLDELQTLNQLAPAPRKPEPTANALPDFGGYLTERMPDYSGLGEVEEFTANESDEDDTTLEDAPLGIPTVNWAEEAKLALPGRERGK